MTQQEQHWLYASLTTGLSEQERAEAQESMNRAWAEQLAEAAAAQPPRRRRPAAGRRSSPTA